MNLTGIKIAAIIIATALVAYLGFVLYSNYKANTRETVSTQSEDVQPAPTISQPSDLDQAESTIEQSEIESNNMDDITEIEKELSEF